MCSKSERIELRADVLLELLDAWEEREGLRSEMNRHHRFCTNAGFHRVVAERDAARAEVEQLKRDAEVVRGGHWDDVLEERDRLRKALEEIAAHDSSTTIDAVAMKRFARAALEGAKP